MKAFIFEAFTQNKIFGSTQAPVEVIVVKNAENKAAARALAENKMSKGLRIAMAGRTYPSPRDAEADATRYCALINGNGGKTIWFAVDAAPLPNNIRLQRSLRALVFP